MIQQYDFTKAMEFVSKSMANGDVRYYLNGVLMRFSKGKILLCATDGHRLSKIEIKSGHDDINGDFIVERKSVNDFLLMFRCKAAHNDVVMVQEKDGRLCVSGNDRTLEMKLIDGKFPEFEKVIPSGEPKGCPMLGINMNYVSSVAASAKIIGASWCPSAIMKTWNENSSLLFEIKIDENRLSELIGPGIVVVMPTRM